MDSFKLYATVSVVIGVSAFFIGFGASQASTMSIMTTGKKQSYEGFFFPEFKPQMKHLLVQQGFVRINIFNLI